MARKKVGMADKLETNEICHTELFSAFIKVCIVDYQCILASPTIFLKLIHLIRNPFTTECVSVLGPAGVFSAHPHALNWKQQGSQTTFWSQHSNTFYNYGSQTSRHWILPMFPTQQLFCNGLDQNLRF